ncbi:MAG: M48 family metalloprotease [Armatimonadota bacterium]|nr:M48 family metalloprotease [Armatimonadota bacterium]
MTRSTTMTKRYVPTTLLLTAWLAALWPVAPAQAGLFSISEQEEIQAGQEVAAQAEKEYGGAAPYNDPMSVRVRAIGAQFARLSTRKNIPYTYKVLNSTTVLNAFAAPGGPIYVTRKLMETTSNDAELAYVLGHETGHIERKHIVKSVAKQQKVGLVAGILGAIIGRGKSGNVIGTIANVGLTVWSRGYGRDQENESDTVGVRWMSQLGYDPRAAISMLGKLGSGGGGFLDKYLSTHPAPKDRQARVEQLINSENLMDVARRSGGPRLSANINYGAYGGYGTNPTSYGDYPSNDNSTYRTPSYGNQGQPANSGSQEINLSAPLVLVDKGETKVITAPAGPFARWAGATVRNTGHSTILRRGGNTIELQSNSTVAYINGRSVRMSAAAHLYQGILYAPIGTLANGVGGEATYDSTNNLVWVRLDNGQRGYMRL